MGWLYLLFAGLFEIGFTTSMRYLGWPPRFWPAASFVIFSALSFWLLSAATRTVPLGTAYAVWTGIGAAGAALLGIVVYREPAGTMRLVLLSVLIGAIIGLKLVSSAQD